MPAYDAVVYNADNGRRNGPRDIARVMRGRDLGFIVETKGYPGDTRHRLGDTHRVFAAPDCMIIVRRSIPAYKAHTHDLRTGGWERAPHNRGDGLHPGRTMKSLVIGEVGHRFKAGVPHLPPPPHGEPGSKYELRGRAFNNGLDTLGRITERWHDQWGSWILAGDWNEPVWDPAIRRWLSRVDAQAHGGGGVDYPIWHGLRVTDVNRIDAGGDHRHATTFTIHP